jgi:hypothetical protein
MCTKVMLGKGKCPIDRPEIVADPKFLAEHAELLRGRPLEELPEVLKQFSQCFECPHFDITSPAPTPAASH